MNNLVWGLRKDNDISQKLEWVLSYGKRLYHVCQFAIVKFCAEQLLE